MSDRAVRAAHRDLLRRIGDELRVLREDAGRSQRWVAAAARVSRSHLGEIETGDAEPGLEVLERLGLALGADLSVRYFGGARLAVRDHLQVAMTTELLTLAAPAWRRRVEVAVYRPVHGVIDVVLEDRRGPTTVSTEVHSQLRRIEQQVRWHAEKTDALAMADGQRDRTSSRLLVLRNTRAMRATVTQAAAVLAVADPARSQDAVTALREGGAWPGAAIVWMDVTEGSARMLDRPPRGITVGR